MSKRANGGDFIDNSVEESNSDFECNSGMVEPIGARYTTGAAQSHYCDSDYSIYSDDDDVSEMDCFIDDRSEGQLTEYSDNLDDVEAILDEQDNNQHNLGMNSTNEVLENDDDDDYFYIPPRKKMKFNIFDGSDDEQDDGGKILEI